LACNACKQPSGADKDSCQEFSLNHAAVRFAEVELRSFVGKLQSENIARKRIQLAGNKAVKHPVTETSPSIVLLYPKCLSSLQKRGRKDFIRRNEGWTFAPIHSNGGCTKITYGLISVRVGGVYSWFTVHRDAVSVDVGEILVSSNGT
jgi:hypothetical protein